MMSPTRQHGRRNPWPIAAAIVSLLALGWTSAQPVPSPEHASFTERIPISAVSFEMVWIEEGGFWIGKNEVTWDEFLSFCDFDHERPEGHDAVTRPSKTLEVAPADRGWGLGQRPAVSMSWNAAQKYCQWLTLITGRAYRLPTEDEWRLAAGDPAPGPIADRAWTRSNSDGRTQEVGLKAPNTLGLHDTLGNLWEYCANPYSEAEPDRAVLRGGSWKDDAETCTPDSRLGFEADWVMNDPNFPPGVWWVPDGDHLGMRVLCTGPGPDQTEEGE